MKNNIDFKTITVCGECCVGCKKKEDGISLWVAHSKSCLETKCSGRINRAGKFVSSAEINISELVGGMHNGNP